MRKHMASSHVSNIWRARVVHAFCLCKVGEDLRQARQAGPLPHTTRALTTRVRESKGQGKGKGAKAGKGKKGGKTAGKKAATGLKAKAARVPKDTPKCVHSRAYHRALNSARKAGWTELRAKERKGGGATRTHDALTRFTRFAR